MTISENKESSNSSDAIIALRSSRLALAANSRVQAQNQEPQDPEAEKLLLRNKPRRGRVLGGVVATMLTLAALGTAYFIDSGKDKNIDISENSPTTPGIKPTLLPTVPSSIKKDSFAYFTERPDKPFLRPTRTPLPYIPEGADITMPPYCMETKVKPADPSCI